MNRIIILLITVLLLGCGSSHENRRRIVVSIEPLRYFAEQIGGDRFEVTTLVPGGSSPEMYEPTARQLMDVAESGAFFCVGNLGFEREWVKRISRNAPHTVIVDTSEGILPLPTSGGGSDAHTWTSPRKAMLLARNIYRVLAGLSAKDSSYFRKNLNLLVGRIRHVDSLFTAQSLRRPHAVFVIYHPALTYLANDYGMTQLTIEEEGREPSAATLSRLFGDSLFRQARVLLTQPEFRNRNIEVVERNRNMRVEEINPLAYDWEHEMMKICNAIYD
jgi:zinc transport system substrate-binding protein